MNANIWSETNLDWEAHNNNQNKKRKAIRLITTILQGEIHEQWYPNYYINNTMHKSFLSIYSGVLTGKKEEVVFILLYWFYYSIYRL